APEAAFPCDGEGSFDWTRVPPVRPPQRLGMFLIPPTGPGYYSALDQLLGNYREKAPNLPFGIFGLTAGSWSDIDFRYLDRPDNTQHDYLDPLKRIHLGDNWLLAFGGQTWVRYMNEVDSRLTAFDNDYTLLRTRVDADLWYKDLFRVYVEYIYAESFGFN